MPGKSEKPEFSFTPPDEPGVIMVGMDVGVGESETVLYVAKPKYAQYHETGGVAPKRGFPDGRVTHNVAFDWKTTRFVDPGYRTRTTIGVIDTEGVEVTQKKMQLGDGKNEEE